MKLGKLLWSGVGGARESMRKRENFSLLDRKDSNKMETSQNQAELGHAKENDMETRKEL